MSGNGKSGRRDPAVVGAVVGAILGAVIGGAMGFVLLLVTKASSDNLAWTFAELMKFKGLGALIGAALLGLIGSAVGGRRRE